MSYIIPKLGDEFAFVGEDFINGIAFVRIIEVPTAMDNYLHVEWEPPEDINYWSTILSDDDFNPKFKLNFTSADWCFHSYSVIKIESEEQKLFLQLKHG